MGGAAGPRGGNIKGLIASLEKIVTMFPADTKVIPGHGDIGTMDDLKGFLTMLKETVAAAEKGIRANKTAEALQKDPAIAKYAKLGEGGAPGSGAGAVAAENRAAAWRPRLPGQ